MVIVFVIVTYLLLWVHVPYMQNQNSIQQYQNQIVGENNYQDVEYFDRYDGDKSYYIIRAVKDDALQYAVFDEDGQFIKSFSDETADIQVAIDDFINRYNVEPTKTAIGYENEIFVYSLTYQGKDSLIYAFYAIDTSEFVKAYRIDG